MLLFKLWELSFLPRHLRSGFFKCGLCPFNRDAIPADKLSKADPHKTSSESERPEEGQDRASSEPVSGRKGSQQNKEAQGQDSEIVVTLSGECTINNTVTPIRLHLKGYFTQLLQKNKQGRKRVVNKQKHKPQFYGEALTMDDFYEKIGEAERKKQEEEKKKNDARKVKKKGKTKIQSGKVAGKAGSKASSTAKKYTPSKVRSRRAVKSKLPVVVPSSSPENTSDSTADESTTDDTGMCEECGRVYKDDNHSIRKSWMGCDSCDRWFHYHCVGLTRIPKGFWSCKYCT